MGLAQAAKSVTAYAHAVPPQHFWEEMVGSGHANLAMREDWRNDLTAVKSVTDMKCVRFHGIFGDENGVCTEDEHGNTLALYRKMGSQHSPTMAQAKELNEASQLGRLETNAAAGREDRRGAAGDGSEAVEHVSIQVKTVSRLFLRESHVGIRSAIHPILKCSSRPGIVRTASACM